MITAAFARTMSAYNTEANARLYAAAARLSDEARRLDRGAFWTSIHGTFSHLLWADHMWMSRFDGWEAPRAVLAQSAEAFPEFDAMRQARRQSDAAIAHWANGLSDAWLEGDLIWFSGATRREIKAPRALLVTHLFNHQTHHRGQVHAMLTAAGQATGAMDLPFIFDQTTRTTGTSS